MQQVRGVVERVRGWMERPAQRLRGWIKARPLTWIAVATIGAFVLGVAASTGEDLSDEVDELRAELDESSAELDESIDLRVQLAAEAAEAAEEADRQAERLRREARNAERDARRALRGREDDLDRRERQLANREDELDERETGIVEREAMRNIEDGVWEVGVDIDPGTYRTSSGTCYNARLTHPNASPGDGLLSNNNGPDTVTLSEGEWFESSRCDWERIGD